MPLVTARAAAGTLGAVLALVLTAPAPDAALRTLGGTGPHDPQTQVLVALVAVLAWSLAGWSCALVALTAGGHLPGGAGRALAAVARRTAPATVRHAVEVALGLTVAAGALSPSASAATGTAAPVTVSRTAAPPAAPALDWGAEPADLAAPVTATAVVVRPGDTLWDLAEQHLRTGGRSEPTDAQVAASWPSWWAANREVVGDDPHLIVPGTVLQPPSAAAHPPAP